MRCQRRYPRPSPSAYTATGGWVRVIFICNMLETNHRTERNTQVVMSSVVEIDFIANIETQPYWSKMCLKPAAWIENPVHVLCAQTGHRTCEGVKSCRPGIEAEVHETSFDGNKGTNCSVPCLDLRTKHSVQDPEIAALQGDRRRNATVIGKTFGERLLEVIVQFRF